MRLTSYTDYALRTMLYLALKNHTATIQEVAAAYDISRNHLMKVVQCMAAAGHLRTVRGKGGGIRLARPPDEVRLGDVVRDAEGDFAIAACFAPDGACRIADCCRLADVFDEALGAFLAVLDRYTLADLVAERDVLALRLGIGSVAEGPVPAPA